MIARNHLVRKTLSFLLTTCMLLSLCGQVFATNETVTRAEAATKFYNYFRWSHHDEYNDIWSPEMEHFTDVKEADYDNGTALYTYYAIECALQQGLVDKTDTFRPNDALTYGEAVSMLARAFGAAEDKVEAKMAGGFDPATAIPADEWTDVFAQMTRDYVSPVQALPVGADTNGSKSFAPRRYIKFWTPSEGTTIYFQKTVSTTDYDDNFTLDIDNAKDDAPQRHASATYDASTGTFSSAAIGQTQIYTVESDGHIKEDYTSLEHAYVSYKVVAVDAQGRRSAERTYHYHLHRPSNTGTEPESGYHIEKVLAANELGNGNPEVWQICRDAESLRAMAWYIKGKDSGILMDALQQHAYTQDGGWSLKDAADQVAAGQPYVLVVGHAHPDHAAQAAYFINAGIPVYANERGFESLRSYVDDTQNPQGGTYGEVASVNFFGQPTTSPAYNNEALVKDIEVGDQLSTGDATFDVYALPGHLDGLVILADREHGMVFATDLYGCTRAGSADNVAVNGVAADLLLSMAQQVRTAYEAKGTKVKVVFTGHDELPLDHDILVNFEEALQNIIDYGNAAFTPTLRGGNNGQYAPTSLINDMWKDYKNWISLQTGNLSTSANTYMSLTDEDAAINANIDYQDPGNKADSYNLATHSYDTSGSKYKTYSVLSNVVVTGGELVGVDLVYKAPKTITWAQQERTVNYAFHNMFNPWHYAYDIKISGARATISLDLTPMSTKADITDVKLNGATVTGLDKISVANGSKIEVTLTAQDGVTTSTYAFSVKGTQSSGSHSGGGSSSASTTAPTTTNNADGSKTETKTNADGSTTKTTTAKDGATTAVTTAKDGGTTTEAKAADGSTGTVKTDASGNTVSAEAKPSEKAVSEAQASGKPVTLAVEVKATNDSKSAAEVKIDVPASVSAERPMQVEVPVENLTAGTVAVLVKPDGTEEIVKTSTTGEGSVVLSVSGDVTLKIVDNTKTFDDVKGDEWCADNIAWASSHEIMNGVGDGKFDMDATTSRGMITQILMNLDGGTANAGDAAHFADVDADDWYAASVAWATSVGVAQGEGEAFGANEAVTREQDIVMMYNYAKYKGCDVSASADLSKFSDADSVSDYAKEAMAWAVAVGLINGSTDENGNIVLDAQGTATRGQIAAITQRFCEKVIK